MCWACMILSSLALKINSDFSLIVVVFWMVEDGVEVLNCTSTTL